MSEWADYDDGTDPWQRRIDEATRFTGAQRRLTFGFALGCAGAAALAVAGFVAAVICVARSP